MLLHLIRRKPTQSAHQCAGRAEYFAVGKIRKGEKAFRTEAEKDESSQPLLFYRAERVWKGLEVWRSERSGERQSPGSALSIKASLSASRRERTYN